MKKLLIHQPTNHESNRFRYYNTFWDDLTKALAERHNVVVDSYYKNAHRGPSLVKLELGDVERISAVSMLECEMIIEDLDAKEIQILSVADDLTSAILNLQAEEKVKKIFVAQFIRDKIDKHVASSFRAKYSPWIYFPSNKYNLDYYFNLRKEKTDLVDKIYFRGAESSRPILNFFNSENYYGGRSIGGFEPYANELINYKVALSIAGRGELCYRDVENMAMGIPMLRFEYLSEMYEPLKPDVHYISVKRPDNLKSWSKLDREGDKEHADMLIERFLEVKEDEDFLRYISQNAREYYENYLSPTASVNHTIKLLNL